MTALRPITRADAGALRTLLEHLSEIDRYFRFFHVVRGAGEIDVASFVDLRPADIGLVAERDGRLIGVAHAFEGGDGMFEFAVVVDPAERRHGVAGELLDRIAAELRSRGVATLIAHAFVANAEFAKLATEHGMRRAATLAGVTQWVLPLSGDAVPT